MDKPDTKPEQPARPQRAPAVTVSGRGRLMVRGDINIIEHQTIVNHPAPKAARTPWRTVTAAAIIAHCTHQLGGETFYRGFVQERFGKATLGELTDDELQRVQQYVFNARVG